MKFVALDKLKGVPEPIKPYFSLTNRETASLQFSISTLKYIRQYKKCISFTISEDKTVLRVSPSELGHNPKDKLSLSNALLRKLLQDRFPDAKKMFFDGVVNEEEHCIDFDLTKHK